MVCRSQAPGGSKNTTQRTTNAQDSHCIRWALHFLRVTSSTVSHRESHRRSAINACGTERVPHRVGSNSTVSRSGCHRCCVSNACGNQSVDHRVGFACSTRYDGRWSGRAPQQKISWCVSRARPDNIRTSHAETGPRDPVLRLCDTVSRRRRSVRLPG